MTERNSTSGCKPVTRLMRNPEKPNRGFKSVAGMDELKKFFVEGFINPLKNPVCAKAFINYFQLVMIIFLYLQPNYD